MGNEKRKKSPELSSDLIKAMPLQIAEFATLAGNMFPLMASRTFENHLVGGCLGVKSRIPLMFGEETDDLFEHRGLLLEK